jgi:hypothetical protein
MPRFIIYYPFNIFFSFLFFWQLVSRLVGNLFNFLILCCELYNSDRYLRKCFSMCKQQINKISPKSQQIELYSKSLILGRENISLHHSIHQIITGSFSTQFQIFNPDVSQIQYLFKFPSSDVSQIQIFLLNSNLFLPSLLALERNDDVS